jgi:hypothetical protein
MKILRNQNLYIFPVVICLALLAIALVRGVRSQGSQNSAEAQERALIEAVRRGGLREAAKIKGRYVASINTSHWLKFDLESLTKNSAAVIIGRPLSSVSRLTPDGEQITTEYQININEVLKGNLTPNEKVNLSLPGGTLVFEDGTSAEIKTPDEERIENGKTYLLFLSPKKGTADGFVATGGAQGLFELPPDKSGVKPKGHRVDPVQKYKNRPADKFLEEIREAVRKHPEASSCCN